MQKEPNTSLSSPYHHRSKSGNPDNYLSKSAKVLTKNLTLVSLKEEKHQHTSVVSPSHIYCGSDSNYFNDRWSLSGK